MPTVRRGRLYTKSGRRINTSPAYAMRAAAIEALRLYLMKVGLSAAAAATNKSVDNYIRRLTRAKYAEFRKAVQEATINAELAKIAIEMGVIANLIPRNNMKRYILEYTDMLRNPRGDTMTTAGPGGIYSMFGSSRWAASGKDTIRDQIQRRAMDQFLNTLHGGFGSIKGGFRILVQDEQLIQDIAALRSFQGRSPSIVLRLSAEEFKADLPFIMEGIIVESMAGITEEGAFPAAYKAHVGQALLFLAREAFVRPAGSWISVGVNFSRMGGYDEFSKAFHYGAMLKGTRDTSYFGALGPDIEGGRVKNLPFTSNVGQLRNPTRRRYEYWKALYTNQSFFSQEYRPRVSGRFKSKKGYWMRSPFRVERAMKARKNKTPINFSDWQFIGSGTPRGVGVKGTWDDTLKERVSFLTSIADWDALAPEWVLVEFGQPKYWPEVPVTTLPYAPADWKDLRGMKPRAITGRFMRIAAEVWTRILRNNMNEYLKTQFPPKGPGVFPMKYNPRAASTFYNVSTRSTAPYVPISGVMNATTQKFLNTAAVGFANKLEQVAKATALGEIPGGGVDVMPTRMLRKWRPIKP